MTGPLKDVNNHSPVHLDVLRGCWFPIEKKRGSFPLFWGILGDNLVTIVDGVGFHGAGSNILPCQHKSDSHMPGSVLGKCQMTTPSPQVTAVRTYEYLPVEAPSPESEDFPVPLGPTRQKTYYVIIPKIQYVVIIKSMFDQR